MAARSKCQFCGEAVAADARYCDHCGTPLAENGRTPSRRRERRTGRVPAWTVIITLLVFMTSGVLAGYRYQSGHWPFEAAAAPTYVPPTDVPVAVDEKPPVDPSFVSRFLASVVSINVRSDQGTKSGTGFIMDNAGHIVTAAHVVDGRSCITVTDDNGRPHAAALVKADNNLDVALLSVPTLSTWPERLSFSTTNLARGTDVIVLGSPKGVANVQTPPVAKVSDLGVDRYIEDHYYRGLAVLSGATVVGGASGGPLVDKTTGQVVGLVVAGARDGQTVAWAVPVEQFMGLVTQWTALKPQAPCALGATEKVVPVTIASITPLSGQYGLEGADLADGVSLAVHDMYEALKAVGYDVKAKSFNDEGKTDVGRAKAEEAAYDPQVLGVVGSLESPVTAAVADSLKSSGMVMVAPTAVAEDLTTRGWTFFNRLVANAARQEPAAARFAKERLNAKSVFLVSEGTSEANRQSAAFEAAAQVISLPVTGKATTATDYNELKRQLADSKADAIYYAGRSDAGFRLVSALRKENITLPFIGGESLYDLSRFGTLTSAQSIYFTRSTAEPNIPFRRHFEDVFKKRSVGYAAYGYDAANVILAALLRYGEKHPAQVPTRAELARLVRETKQFPGESSIISFDPHGDNLDSWVYVLEWKQGGLAFRENFR